MKKTTITLAILASLLTGNVMATKLVVPDILDPLKPEITLPAFERKGATIQVAIILDTSNSMDGLLAQAKQQVWEIVNSVSQANRDQKGVILQVSLLEYGKSTLSVHDNFLQVLTPLTSDLDAVSEQLFALRTKGGKEMATHAVMASLNRLAWSDHPDDLRLVVVAGNEAFKQGTIPVSHAINLAKDKDVIINTVYCGEKMDGLRKGWSMAAESSGGKYLNINQNVEVDYIITPYDDHINLLGKQLNDTYLHYGVTGALKKERQMVQDSFALEESVAVAASRNVAKSGANYDATEWDLVSVFKDNRKDAIAKAKASSLRGKTDEEVQASLQNQLDDRVRIESEIKSLERQRSGFIAEKKVGEATEGFSDAILSAVKTQASAKGFVFKK
jgi:hypothetical protein